MSDKPEISQAQITHTANIIRQTFYSLKSARLGRQYKPNHRLLKGNVWEKAALNAIQCGANPVLFVEAAFDYCQIKGGPNPEHLGGQAAPKWFAMRRRTTDEPTPNTPEHMDPAFDGGMGDPEEELKMALEHALRYCYATCGFPIPHKAFMDVLSLPSTPVPMTIKALLGFQYKHEQIMKEYGLTAQKTLIEHPSYAEAARRHGLPADEILHHVFPPPEDDDA